jgi:CRP-like cAMP-binding protein
MMEERAAVERVAAFFGLSAGEIAAVQAIGHVVECDAGQVILREGDEGDEAYVLLDGEVAITQGTGPSARDLGRARPNEVLGELALFGSGIRTATVRAIRPSRLLAIERQAFLALLHEYPSLAINLLRYQTRRLARAEAELHQLRARLSLPGRGCPP